MTTTEHEHCDECGSRLDYRGNCATCTNDYALGKQDADDYHTALDIGGEDMAVRMEMESEYGWMG